VRSGETGKSDSDASPYREKLIEIYGKDIGSIVKYCKALEDSGYGAKLTKKNMVHYFPFLKK
jgi:hypothetical protein